MDKNLKSEIGKNIGPPKEKEKNKETNKDITLLKSYRVPDANNKKYFDKINTFNFIGIMKFISFPEMAEFSFVNKQFHDMIDQKFPKRIPLIKTTITVLKKNFFFNFSEDFRFHLRKNSWNIKGIIKKMIESLQIEYFPKMKVKKYFFNKTKVNPGVTKLFLSNCELGKKSIKYLSYFLENKNNNIVDIDMSGNKITGDILKPMCSNPNIALDNLKANKCIIDLKTFINLSDINIKKLSLTNNNLDNEYISKLTNNNIRELNIAHNYLSNEGVFSICKNLPNLTKLNLANNNICDLSIVYISLYIKNPNNKLSSLNLKDNKITITGMMTLLSTIEKINKVNKGEKSNNNNKFILKKLNLSGNLLDLVPIPKRLGRQFLNIYVEKLCLGNHSFNINVLNILFNFINNIHNIIILDLSKIVFDNVSLNLIFNRVSENISLKKLKLKNCYLGNTEVNNTLETYYTKSEIKNEKNWKKAASTSLNDNINEENDFDNDLYEINTNSSINDKSTHGSDKINNEDKITNKDNDINNLNLDINLSEEIKIKLEEIEDNNTIVLSTKEKEKKKDNNKKNIINESIGIESLDLGYNFINYHKLDKIILSNHIKELNIEGNDLHLWRDDIYLFFDFIINNKVLEKLNLNKNNLQSKANKLLEKINKFNSDNNSNCSLKYLSLEDNQIKEINLELTNLLSNNKNLEFLKLQKNLINDEIGNNYFFHSLFKSKNSNIKEIDISNNKITLSFIEKIIKYSKENSINAKNFVLNITSKEIREAYLNIQNKEPYKELVLLKNIKCF